MIIVPYLKSYNNPLPESLIPIDICVVQNHDIQPVAKLYKKINPKRVVCFRRKIKKLAIKVLEGTSTYENVENTFKSWMGAYYKLLTKVQRENLITLYEDLFNKRIDIVNKKMVITNKE